MDGKVKSYQKLELLNSPCAKVTLLRNVYLAPLSIALFEEQARQRGAVGVQSESRTRATSGSRPLVVIANATKG